MRKIEKSRCRDGDRPLTIAKGTNRIRGQFTGCSKPSTSKYEYFEYLKNVNHLPQQCWVSLRLVSYDRRETNVAISSDPPQGQAQPRHILQILSRIHNPTHTTPGTTFAAAATIRGVNARTRTFQHDFPRTSSRSSQVDPEVSGWARGTYTEALAMQRGPAIASAAGLIL